MAAAPAPADSPAAIARRQREGYFFARADLEAVRRPAVEGVARAFPEGASCPRRPRNRAAL
jgi:hypothetical protein